MQGDLGVMCMFVISVRLFLMANNLNKTISKNPQSSQYSHLPLQDGLKTSRMPHGAWFTDSLRPVWILVIVSTGTRSNLSFSDSVLQLSWLSCFSLKFVVGNQGQCYALGKADIWLLGVKIIMMLVFSQWTSGHRTGRLESWKEVGYLWKGKEKQLC